MLLGIPRSARCVQRFDDSLKICNSHYLSHFAAFFIDARAKRSVVESCISLSTLFKARTYIFTFYETYDGLMIRRKGLFLRALTIGSQVCVD
jgi:hypothetical protein